jgi:hypothetical protein
LANEGGAVTFTSCTFSANGGSTGGASFSSTAGTTTIVNTIAANRKTSTECVGTLVDGGGNLRYPDKSYAEDICPGIVGNPLLGPLQLNGGKTMTMALGQGSATIDTALDGPCIGEPILGLDQRGISRPQGPHCDIGALEQKPYASARRSAIDIKPGSDPNSVNCQNINGVITVAIFTTPAFDARSVDHTTVSFEGAGDMHVDRITGQPIGHEEDVDRDGDIDLVFHFRLGSTYLTCESTGGLLQGYTYAGEWLTGADTVRMVRGG